MWQVTREVPEYDGGTTWPGQFHDTTAEQGCVLTIESATFLSPEFPFMNFTNRNPLPVGKIHQVPQLITHPGKVSAMHLGWKSLEQAKILLSYTQACAHKYITQAHTYITHITHAHTSTVVPISLYRDVLLIHSSDNPFTTVHSNRKEMGKKMEDGLTWTHR